MNARYCAALLLLSGLSPLILPACTAKANAYDKFFTSMLRPPSVLADSALIPHVGEPAVYAGEDLEEDNITMFEDGYVLVGHSDFIGTLENPKLAKAKARSLRAAAVFLYNTNPQTQTQVVPVYDFSTIADVLNPPKKETTRTTGTVYGSGASVNYTETSTKTVPTERKARQTVAYTTTRYEQTAMFWVKAKRARLGIAVRDLTSAERASRGSNRGAVIVAVAKGSPAFLADIMRGDILLHIGETQIAQATDFPSALDRHAGTEVDVQLVRGKEEKVIRVRLNS